MGNTVAPSRIHRALRGFLILVSLTSTVAFLYFSSKHGILVVNGKTFPVPADVAALSSPVVGILALWLATLVENHERHHGLIAATVHTFLRLWWTLAFVVFVGAWIWFSNHM